MLILPYKQAQKIISYGSTSLDFVLVTVVLGFNYGSTGRNGTVHFQARKDLFDQNNHVNFNL